MTARLVLPYFGDEASRAALAAARAGDCQHVIALVCDLDGAHSLAALRDAALAAGATRCHVLDLRQEFLEAAVLPALRAGTLPRGAQALTGLATRFIAGQAVTVAAIEQAEVVARAHPGLTDICAMPRSVADGRATLVIDFADGSPCAINGVPMTLVELVESVQTIAGRPAIDVLRLAYTALAGLGGGRVLVDGDGARSTAAPAPALA